MTRPDELKAIVEQYLEGLAFWPELHAQAQSMHYALVEMGGKRIRPVISLATGEAAGAPLEQILPAAAAVELVHNFSLVHDDLPALDADEERRGKPSVWAAFGEG
ncbi:MAG TPA: polyprenyl synthetase family protein, partial [Gaiellaceae bacterium]|nr:polyprenyl synthetase family protein [Gaiellaceae bacterium]